MCAQHPTAQALDEFREWAACAKTVAGIISTSEIWNPDRIVAELESYPDVLRAVLPEDRVSPFYVPEEQPAEFLGRDSILSEIDRLIQSGEANPILITGMAGVGKTCLVSHFVHTRRAGFSEGVYWIDGQQDLIQQLARFGIAQGIAPPATNEQASAQAFLQHLRHFEHALLIVDDIDRPNLVNEPLAGSDSLASIGIPVLLTSRFAGLAARGGAKLSLETPTVEEAIKILASASQRQDLTDKAAPEHGSARELCRALGYLPLALEIAGSFLAVNPGVSVRSYLDRINQEGALTSVGESERSTLHLVERHEASIAASIRMAYESIRDSEAKQLFQVLCALPEGEAVTRQTLSMLVGGFAGERKKKAEKSLAWLENSGLVSTDQQGVVCVHPLAKWFGRSLLDSERRSELAAQIAESVRLSVEGILEAGIPVDQAVPSGAKIFLCYAGADRSRVSTLYERLQRDGFRPWMDKKLILPGQDWELEIRRAIEASDFFLACISQHFRRRTYGHKEIKLALEVLDTMPEGTLYFIPVRLEECEVENRLSSRQWVDLFNDKGYETLVRALRSREES
jgi:hypothetical protein